MFVGGAGQEVAVPELSDSIKIAVLKGTLSHLLDQEVRTCSTHDDGDYLPSMHTNHNHAAAGVRGVTHPRGGVKTRTKNKKEEENRGSRLMMCVSVRGLAGWVADECMGR
jgi:hypothetical protein